MLFSFLSQYPVVGEAFPVCDFTAIGLDPALGVVICEKGIRLTLPVDIVPAIAQFIELLPDFLNGGRSEIREL